MINFDDLLIMYIYVFVLSLIRILTNFEVYSIW